jgi:3',5'-cyclic AMP phosphodiesterase CpdA
MSFRVAQISDTHLSAERPYFLPNFQRIGESLTARRPDLVINTGDMTLDGADQPEELRFVRSLHDTLGIPCLALPGNHDVGDDPALRPRQPLDTRRLASYRANFGPDRFLKDVPGWRLIGINGLLTEAQLPDAAEQIDFLSAAVADAGSRSIALFLHKPLTLGTPDPDGTYWRVRDKGREALLGAFGAQRPSLIASGHLHQYRRMAIDGTLHVWAPSTAFIVGDRFQQRVGTKLVGYVEHRLDPDGGCATELVTVDGMALDDIGHLPEVYGPQKPVAAPTFEAAQ